MSDETNKTNDPKRKDPKRDSSVELTWGRFKIAAIGLPAIIIIVVGAIIGAIILKSGI